MRLSFATQAALRTVISAHGLESRKTTTQHALFFGRDIVVTSDDVAIVDAAHAMADATSGPICDSITELLGGRRGRKFDRLDLAYRMLAAAGVNVD